MAFERMINRMIKPILNTYAKDCESYLLYFVVEHCMYSRVLIFEVEAC